MRLSPEFRLTLERGMERLAAGAEAMAPMLPPVEPGRYLNLNPADGSYRVEDQRGFGAGFLAGKLWILSDYSGSETLRRAAVEVTRWCEILTEANDADIGFVSQYAPAMGHLLTGEDWMKRQALRGCDSFLENFEPGLGILMIWPPHRPKPDFVSAIPRRTHGWETYVDLSSCGSVLWWARRFDPRYGEVIQRHQEGMSRLGLIQPDGRVHHMLGFDPATGQPIELHTAQGYDDHSHWTRAQGWGMNSSVFAFEATGERQFLDAATRTCDYFLDQMIGDGDVVPFYDLEDPRIPDVPRDTCTTALAANAMVRLIHERPELESRYGGYVEAAITELFEHHVTTEGIVLHGSWGNMWGNAAECVMPYGNLYLAETVYRLLKPGSDLWGTRPA